MRLLAINSKTTVKILGHLILRRVHEAWKNPLQPQVFLSIRMFPSPSRFLINVLGLILKALICYFHKTAIVDNRLCYQIYWTNSGRLR